MNKLISFATGATFIAAALIGPMSAYAQTSAFMPALYNQSDVQVNSGNSAALPAGYYYLQPGGTQVYYYGNGTYYNPSTETYGGSVSDANGVAGVALNYNTSPSAPGVPNTGAGGDAGIAWMTLILSGAVALVGVAYLLNSSRKKESFS